MKKQFKVFKLTAKLDSTMKINTRPSGLSHSKMESGKCIQIFLTTVSIFGTILLVIFVALEYNKDESLTIENSLSLSSMTSKVSQTSTESTTMTSSSSTGPICKHMDWYADGVCDGVNNDQACHFDGGDCNPGCPIPVLAGDGICDEQNNVERCHYDDGDCIEVDTTTDLALTNEITIATDESQCQTHWYGDGYCDLFQNVAICDFDGGDCDFLSGIEDESLVECVDNWIGDAVCDPNNYFEKCNFDGGDCDNYFLSLVSK